MSTTRAQDIRARKADPSAAREVIESVFKTTPGSKIICLEFLAKSMEYLFRSDPGNWGLTLFEWGARLNAGPVESLILDSGGLRVLVEKESVTVHAPA